MLSQQREEAGRVPSYPDHGGLNSGEGTLMAAVTGMVNAPLPTLKQLGKGVEKVEEDTTERFTSCGSRFCGGA